MYRQERYELIISILQEKRSVTVNYLAKKLYVSVSTIRRDLQALEQQGTILHYYGGATLINDASKALPFEIRRQEMHTAKMRIGQEAAALVSNGDTIFVDASSTCLCMVEGLRRLDNLTIMTNGMRVLEALEEKNFTTYSTGGKLLRNSMAFTGHIAEDCLKELHFDKCFFSCQAISKEGIMSDGGEAENQIHRILMQQKGLKILLCDRSKLDNIYMFRIGRVEQLDYIISNANIFESIQEPTGDSPIVIQVT